LSVRSSEVETSVPSAQGHDGPERILTPELKRERRFFTYVRHLASACVLTLLTFSFPPLALSQPAPADGPHNVNAPWDDLLSALGRKNPSGDEPTNTAPMVVPQHEAPDQVDATGKPAAVDPRPVNQIVHPGDEGAPQIAPSRSRQARATRRRAKGEERRAQGPGRPRETTSMRGSRQAKRAHVQEEARQRPTSMRRDQRRARSRTGQVAVEASVHLPEGLTPRHAMPRP
jgi:hypothetical protein